MKAWQIFVIGAATLVAILCFPLYESMMAGIAALAVVAAVAFGFAMRPRRDVFYVDTRTYFAFDDEVYLEHDHLAVKVEMVRLWLLFVPTCLALAFLVVTAAKGTIWKISFLNRVFDDPNTAWVLLLICRPMLLLVFAALSVWISERWVIREAQACSARSVSIREARVLFVFLDRKGGYYSGEGFAFGSLRSASLATLVLYNVKRPELNKIGMGLLFHRLVILGRGLTDLDETTVSDREVVMQPDIVTSP